MTTALMCTNQPQNKGDEMLLWRDAILGVVGVIATVTLQEWSYMMSGTAGTLTSIFVGWKIWKGIVRPWMKQKRLIKK